MKTAQDLENTLVKTVQLILDDPHGITEDAHASLMELVYKINPQSRALNYLTEASNYKGRVFLEEGVVVL